MGPDKDLQENGLLLVTGSPLISTANAILPNPTTVGNAG